MKFYNREKEIKLLANIQEAAEENAQMVTLMGRRRIGKTKLLFHATQDTPTLYFFVARKAEPLLCRDFIDEITSVLRLPIYGEIQDFKTIFQLLMDYSKTMKFNLVIDEFQEFYTINPSVYSDMQHLWDRNKDNSHICLFLCGSIYSLMHRIFEGNHEPLFGRATQQIFLKPFSTITLKQILSENNPGYTSEDLLAFYAFTGGVAKYVELFVDNKALTHHKMIKLMCQENSPFLSEGKNILIEEFGKEYTIYFSILSCIANGFTARTAIESYLQREIGGYLTRLENDFNIIKKRIPMFSKAESRNVRYEIEDNFLRFWFRFFYKYIRYIEAGALEKLQEIIIRDYPTFSGHALEEYFKCRFREKGEFTALGGYWNRKGEDEIDLIALDEIEKKAIVAEIKRNRQNIKMDSLMLKGASIQKELNGYSVEYRGLSMEDM